MKRFRFLFCLTALMFFGQVRAQFSVAGDAIEVTPGKSYDMEILLSNTGYDDIYSITIDITLPNGIEATGVTFSSRFNPGTIKINKPEGKDYYRLVAADMGKTITVSGESGVIATVTLTIPDAIDLSTPLTATFSGVKAATVSKNIPTWGNGKAEAYTFTIKEASAVETEKITLTKEYNTYVPKKALDFSSVEGITAYYVTAVTATEATITETTTVAAGEGIILKGTADAEYEVPVATTEVGKSTTNKLATGTVAEGDYILFDGKFVPCTGGTLPDGKAYLPKAAISTSSAKALILGFGDATGINEAKAAKADGAIYSISGVRVAEPQKGVYIMNGRKVIVK